jgi:prepilin-type N-terminal cleavage/methylation domain-containing protein
MHFLKKGFTLAEVLITLLIIGVVAALVIPNIIQDAQDAELKTAWKKSYSSINQAFGQILIDNGGTFTNAAGDNFEFRNLFINKLNGITTSTDPIYSDVSVKKLDGTTNVYNFGNTFVMNDGSVLSMFQLDTPDCTHRNYVSTIRQECGWLLVDVNGVKKPNQWGKDIYGIWVLNNRILPWGANPVGTASATYRENTCTTSASGYGCGAKYLYN